jgi:Uma2 family endonuclease
MVTELKQIKYPESDGKPMADNTLQYRWIVTIQGGIDAMFKDNPDVFVAGDLLWYPVEGNNKIRVAPDVMVVCDRPKGERGSYLQWKENNVTPQVVFEILSPGNTLIEMARKLQFYNNYGVEEYYLYDPEKNDFSGWIRRENGLEVIENIDNWISPRLRIRFVLGESQLEIYRPDGKKFVSFLELDTQRQLAEERANLEEQRANLEEQRANSEEQRANLEEQRANSAEEKAQRLADKLKELDINPDDI